jgi:hypothetical protein
MSELIACGETTGDIGGKLGTKAVGDAFIKRFNTD